MRKNDFRRHLLVIAHTPKAHAMANTTAVALEQAASDAQAVLLFTQASEKELVGLMAEAIGLYRQAYRLNDKVDKLWRDDNLQNEARTQRDQPVLKVDEKQVKRINVDALIESFEGCEAVAPDPLDPMQAHLTHSRIKIDNWTPQYVPVSPLVRLLPDIWVHILLIVVSQLPLAWFNMSMTCKKYAYLGFGLLLLWRCMCRLVFPNQQYPDHEELRDDLDQLVQQYNSSYHTMLRLRPFIKFKGCYISVVNYYSEGARESFTSSWLNPVHIVTYYRYLRFYPDGTCIKLLTTLEPSKVVPHFLRYNTLKSVAAVVDEHGVVHNAGHARDGHRIFHGTWTISEQGQVHITIENGLVPYCVFHYNFNVKNLGGLMRHSKLSWVNYYARRIKLLPEDDRDGEVYDFSLKNEKLFKFLRVKRYEVNT